MTPPVTNDRFIRLAACADVPPGGGVPIDVSGRIIALFNVDGVFHAVDNECPHKGGSLAEGALQGTNIVCPLHRWQFSLVDGRNPVSRDLCVRSYPLEIRGGDVWIDPN